MSSSAWACSNGFSTTAPAPSPGVQPCDIPRPRNMTDSALPARSTAATTAASTTPDSSSICATSSALSAEFSSAEIVNAGPEKSQSALMREAMMLPMKLVNWLTGTASNKVSCASFVNSTCCSALSVTPETVNPSSICLARFTRPRKRCSSSSDSIATSTATFWPAFRLVC